MSGLLRKLTQHNTAALSAVSLGCAVLAGVFLIPFFPLMPISTLDSSWSQALNEAVARHFVFGREVIYTYGPLASVQTCVYHPATDIVMMLGRLLIASGLCAGYIMLCWPRRMPLLCLLPFLTASVWISYFSFDAIAIALPFLLFCVILRLSTPISSPLSLQTNWMTVCALSTLTCAVSILPLIKGTYTVVATANGALSIAIMFLSRKGRLALLLMSLAILTLALGWIGVGQPLSSFSPFFLSQIPVISGYSAAMSSRGPLLIVFLAIVVMAAMVIISHRNIGDLRFKRLVPLALSFSMFIAFKAGFVRQDVLHLLYIIGTLIFMALALASLIDRRTAVGITAIISLVSACLFTIFPLPSGFLPADERNPFSRVVVGVQLRRNHQKDLRDRFDRAYAEIRATNPLAHVEGKTDLYPDNLAVLFAANDEWAPRPVVQSFQAYNEALDHANRSHLLLSSAPKHVFFAVSPIDERLPALDDAGSWPILINEYRPVAMDGNYIHLERRTTESLTDNSVGGVIERAVVTKGQWVDVPSTPSAVWARIDLRPTLAGTVVLGGFRLPTVFIEMLLDDGAIVGHRYIPEIGRSGFILSPYIGSTNDFLCMASGTSPRTVRKFRIVTGGWGLWGERMEVIFAPLRIPTVRSAGFDLRLCKLSEGKGPP